MREFSVGDFAAHLVAIDLATAKAAHHGLARAAQLIERDAKRQIGHYQGEAGPFEAWAPLADRTEAEKARLGYPENAPLLRDGSMRDSISHEVDGMEAVVGSTSDLAVYHELGTTEMPARPSIGPAAFKNREAVQRILGESVGRAIAGEPLGYGGDGNFVGLPE